MFRGIFYKPGRVIFCGRSLIPFFTIFFIFLLHLCSANVVINEVMYLPFSEETDQQWVELYNDSDSSISLHHWQLQSAGASFSPVFAFPYIVIEPFGFLLIGGDKVEGADLYADLWLPAGNGITQGIRLLSPAGYRDTVLYGEPNSHLLPDDSQETGVAFAPLTPMGHSLARISDGYDTDNNSGDWFASAVPTPGYSNAYLIDLAIDELHVSEINGRIRVSLKVINPSTVTVVQNSASLRVFLNGDCYGFHALPELLPEYQSTEFIFLEGLNDGYYSIDVRLLYQYDPDFSNNQLQTAFIRGSSPLILNELLFKQSASNQEWVEIYNRSLIPVTLKDFYFEDAAANRTNFNGVILPKTYKIICRNKQQFLDLYGYVTPDLVIESTSWAILNNDGETLLLADQYGIVFDYTEYTAPASYPADLSLERINPYDDNSLWERCRHPEQSTPAAQNSWLPLQYDLAILETSLQESGNLIEHEILIANAGYNMIEEFRLKCQAYREEAETGFILYDEFFTISTAISITFLTELPSAAYTTYHYSIESAQDLDPSNNYTYTFYNNNALPVVINEIMFRPHTGEPRWLELKVNNFYKYLKAITLETERYIVTVPLSEYEYIILVNSAADSLFITENYSIGESLIVTGLTSIYVSGEELILFDPAGNIFENFTYDPDWSKTRGVSAERINPLLAPSSDNWAHSIHPAGSTPGQKNSIYTPFIPEQTALSLSPNPFSPFRGERIIISFELPERLNRVTCRIFDLKGRLVDNIVNQEIHASRGNLIWDGTSGEGKYLPVGVYIIMLEAAGSDSEKIYRKQATAVIGR